MTVVEILMERDDMTKEEAVSLIDETREEILTSNLFEAEEIMMDMLGLEMDYIFEILL